MTRFGGIDPDRIAARLFGGPHMMVGWADAEYQYNNDKTRRWKHGDVRNAWQEQHNAVGESLIGDNWIKDAP